jgi:hypothetical protein
MDKRPATACFYIGKACRAGKFIDRSKPVVAMGGKGGQGVSVYCECRFSFRG